MRSAITLLAVFFLCGNLTAQRSSVRKTYDPRDYQYKREFSGGVRIQTNGLSLYAEHGWIKDIYRTHYLQAEYNLFINYAQKRINSPLNNGRDFLYGVQNKFHALRLNYGIRRSIADKAAYKGVRLSFTAFGGISLGLLKPYYLVLLQPSDNGIPVFKEERYSPQNASRFLSLDSIAEAAPMRFGLNQIEPIPGLHGKIGLDFDWGSKDEFVKALECGVMLDLYYKRIPVMINRSNRFYQIGLYLGFHFGKRW
ncbi:MAG: hypothetical protein NZM35_04235 [Chitinophagales bacterium]|nr:hypothetical protein [Chitinophagales bacterium]MDW8418410.1 hypothetical protein [Chitinophagales bacterium]